MMCIAQSQIFGSILTGLICLICLLACFVEFSFQDKSSQGSIYEGLRRLTSLDSGNCFWIWTMSSENAREESVSHEAVACPSTPPLYSFFIALALCLDLYQKIKITVLTALIKPSLPLPEPYSYTNIILSRYKLQIPQKPPQKTDL